MFLRNLNSAAACVLKAETKFDFELGSKKKVQEPGLTVNRTVKISQMHVNGLHTWENSIQFPCLIPTHLIPEIFEHLLVSHSFAKMFPEILGSM